MAENVGEPVDKQLNPESLLDEFLSRSQEEIRPWESVILPSKGLYYGGALPGGVVEVRPWGLYADKVMATQRLARSGESLNYLFKHHVRLPGEFDPLNLTADDRIFLLWYLRGITHGSDYEFIVKCPECEQPGPHNYDLTELWSTVRFPDESLGNEPFKVVLPICTEQVKRNHPDAEFWVKIRFLRGYDTMDMMDVNAPAGVGRARNRNRKKDLVRDKIVERGDNLDETIEKNINRVIVEVMGSTNRSKIQEFVKKLHAADIAAIMDFLRDKSPGIDTSIQTDCPNAQCKATFVVPLPITESFFRPTRPPRTGT